MYVVDSLYSSDTQLSQSEPIDSK